MHATTRPLRHLSGREQTESDHVKHRQRHNAEENLYFVCGTAQAARRGERQSRNDRMRRQASTDGVNRQAAVWTRYGQVTALPRPRCVIRPTQPAVIHGLLYTSQLHASLQRASRRRCLGTTSAARTYRAQNAHRDSDDRRAVADDVETEFSVVAEAMARRCVH